MVARHYFRDASDTLIEVTDRIPREGWTGSSHAEEGVVGSWTVVLVDPAMDLAITGLRRWIVLEDTSEDNDDILWAGYTAAQEISRGEDGVTFEPLGRTWSVELVDENSVWARRVMVGTDCKRPAETDVERMQWLLSTSEASSWFVNVTDYVDTASPVNMDKNDYTGQMFNAVADSCAQQSGKNWFARQIRNPITDVSELCAFYGEYTYDSPLFLSNDPDDLVEADLEDGTSLVWPLDMTTKLRRDPQAVYDGAYGKYEKGSLFRRRAATTTEFGHRDMVVPMDEVKTKTKANARLQRALIDASSQDETIAGVVQLPAAKATMFKAGMRTRLKAVHLPGYETWHWMRIRQADPTPVAGGGAYSIRYVLQGPGDEYTPPWVCPLDAGITGTEAGFYGPLGGTTTDSRGNIWYSGSNLSWFTDNTGYTYIDGPRPNNAFLRGFAFPDYGTVGGDAGGTGVASIIGFVFAGEGTIDASMLAYGATNAAWEWALGYTNISGAQVQDSATGFDAGDTVSVVTGALPSDATSCYRFFTIKIGGNIGGGGTKLVFPGLTWTPS